MSDYKNIIISWSYGKKGIYLDCYMDVNDIVHDVAAVPMIEMRTRTQGSDAGVGLFNVPKDWTREEMETIIGSLSDGQLEDAKKHLQEGIVTFHASDSVDKFKEHMELLPLLMGQRDWMDEKIKEAFGYGHKD